MKGIQIFVLQPVLTEVTKLRDMRNSCLLNCRNNLSFSNLNAASSDEAQELEAFPAFSGRLRKDMMWASRCNVTLQVGW